MTSGHFMLLLVFCLFRHLGGQLEQVSGSQVLCTWSDCSSEVIILTTNLLWEVLPKANKGQFGKYFPKPKKGSLGSTSQSQKMVVWEVLPKAKKGQFGKYFLKSKMVTLGSTSQRQKRVVWEVLPKVKNGHFGKYFLKSKMVTLGSTS